MTQMNLQDIEYRIRGWLLSLTCCLHWIEDDKAENVSFGVKIGDGESKISVRNVGRHVIGRINFLSVIRQGYGYSIPPASRRAGV